MEIEIDKIGSDNYYSEVLAVMSNYSKLVKSKAENEGIKFTGNSINRNCIGVSCNFCSSVSYESKQYPISMCNHYIFNSINFRNNLYFPSQKKKFKNNDSYKKLIIEDEYVELHIGDEQYRLNFNDICWIILNKYSITFLPKTEGSTLIAVEIKYKNQIIDNIKEKHLIVDNSNLFQS